MRIVARRLPWGFLLLACLAMSGATSSCQGQSSPASTVALPRPTSTSEPASPAAGSAGGAAQADFDSLIELIQSTIAPDDWDDVGGESTIREFPGGVFVDAQGVLAAIPRSASQTLTPKFLDQLHGQQDQLSTQDWRQPATHRHLSLLGIAREWRQLHDVHQSPDVVLRTLAGLQRIDYVILDETTHDVILVGPAGPWTLDASGRAVSETTGRPVMQLDDLIVVLHNMLLGSRQMVCAITPTQDGLARAREFAITRSNTPVAAGRRAQWLEDLREALGHQKIDVWGVAPDTRVARVLVEADHHMKQIGIGLQPGTAQVPSYLDRIAKAGDVPEQVDVLRWWFTLHPDALIPLASPGCFQLGPQAIRVLSENEWLTERGQRVATGQSEVHNAGFARDFTRNILALSRLYPVYADLDNLFRVSLVAALIQEEADEQPQRTNALREWVKQAEPTVARLRAPRTVESIVNARDVNRRRFVAAVSGGVRFDLQMAAHQANAPRRTMRTSLSHAVPANRWWWDPVETPPATSAKTP